MTSAELALVVAHVQSGGLVRILRGPIDDFARVYKGMNGWMIVSHTWHNEHLASVRYGDLGFYRRVELE